MLCTVAGEVLGRLRLLLMFSFVVAKYDQKNETADRTKNKESNSKGLFIEVLSDTMTSDG